MVVKGDKKHMECNYLMRVRNPFSLYVLFMTIYYQKKKDSFLFSSIFTSVLKRSR